MAPANDDPFDDLLTLEDTLYTTAHEQGVADGAKAGRIEGRIFGLEKGFEKFAALGKLHGRGAIWGSRIPPATSTSTVPSTSAVPEKEAQENAPSSPSPNPQIQTQTQPETSAKTQIPSIKTPSTRLQSNISLLYHLTDPLTFDTSNTEVAVADFDDRFKRAGAKAKVVERIIGETSSTTVDSRSPERGNGGRNVRLEGEGKRGGKKGDDSMEDFGGSRLIG